MIQTPSEDSENVDIIFMKDLYEKINETLSNSQGYAFPNSAKFIGNEIKLIISEINRLKPSSDDVEPVSKQLESIANEFFQVFSELDHNVWFQNAIMKHNDEAYYPKQYSLIKDKLVEIEKQLNEQYLTSFQILSKAKQESINVADYKHFLKLLKDVNPSDIDEKNKIGERINVLFKKGLFFSKSQNEAMALRLKEIENININDDEIQINQNGKLGSGGFGTVMKGIYLKTSELVAVKQIRIDRLSPSSVFSFFVEITTMNMIKHPNVLQLVGARTEIPFRIITRFCEGKSLFERLHHYKKNNLPELNHSQLTKIAYQIALGMEYLHKQQIVHRDLKTLNILLDEYNNAYVADFGLSGSIKDKRKLSGGAGTTNYAAPEILARVHYDSQVDVYSYSILLWEMYHKTVPFSDLQPVDIYEHVVRNDWRLPINQECPKGLKKLITQAWSKNPKDRPTFSQIVELFRSNQINFSQTGHIDCQKIENDKHCPPIDEEYLLNVLTNKHSEYFSSVAQFIADNMDNSLKKLLKDKKILDSLTEKPNEQYASSLMLALKLLQPYTSIQGKKWTYSEQTQYDEWTSFMEKGGKTMLENCLKTKNSPESLKAAITFATKMPNDYIDIFKPYMEDIISSLGIENSIPDGIIIQLLQKIDSLNRKMLVDYEDKIVNYLIHIPASNIDSKDTFDSFVYLFQKRQKRIIQIQNSKTDKEDHSHLVNLISLKYPIDPSFVQIIISLIGNNSSASIELLQNLLEAMSFKDQDQDLSMVLKDFIDDNLPNGKGNTIFDDLAKDTKTLNILCSCLREKPTYSVLLYLVFCIARRPGSPPHLAKHEIIQVLLDYPYFFDQRLNIFAALTFSEQFCMAIYPQNQAVVDGIIHLLCSSYNSNHKQAMRLTHSLSTHKTGCEILDKYDVLEYFIQPFLSSSFDPNISYSIIRNALHFEIEIPKIPLIVSTLLENFLSGIQSKEKILDTLVAIVKRTPRSVVQTNDLQDYILSFPKLEQPYIVLQSLRLLKAIDLNKLCGNSAEMANNILSTIHQVLKSPTYHHIKIICAALSTIKKLFDGQVQINLFIEQTQIVEYAKHVLSLVPSNESKYRDQITKFINDCAEYQNRYGMSSHS